MQSFITLSPSPPRGRRQLQHYASYVLDDSRNKPERVLDHRANVSASPYPFSPPQAPPSNLCSKNMDCQPHHLQVRNTAFCLEPPPAGHIAWRGRQDNPPPEHTAGSRMILRACALPVPRDWLPAS